MMNPTPLLTTLLLAGTTFLHAAGQPVIPLWPNGLPEGSKQYTPSEIAELKSRTTADRIAFVDNPSLTLFQAPANKANGCGLIIAPGGAYNILAWPKEGLEVAEYFNTVGVTCAVLQYRVPRRDPGSPHREPLQDAQRALRIMRHNASTWGVDPARIGILGFSAGGHLATMAALHFEEQTYPKTDTIDDLSARPDFLCPIYPAYYTHEREFQPLNPLMKVTPQSPPTYIAVTSDDALRGVNAAQFYIELQQAGVSAELHIYHKGGHGYGIRPSDNAVSHWHNRCAEWMQSMGLLNPSKKEAK